MRPSGRGPLESLYFDYPQFDPPDPSPALTDPLPIAIVGAGPVGLTAALALAAQGQRSTVFEARPTFNDGSRAICISRSSYNIFRALGVERAFLEKSLPWVSGRSFYRGREVLEFFMPDDPQERFRPMYNLQQQYIEAFLHAAAAANPLIELRWQSEVTAIADTDDGVILSVRDPHMGYDVRADWVLAADGARSAVRRLRGLRLEGENFEGRYVIADIRMHHPCKVERFALFDPDARPGGTVLVHQQPDDIWRIDYQLRPGEDEAEAMAEAAIRASVARVLKDLGREADWDLEWWSVYSANTLALPDYRDGRVFFVGDSAHIVPIFGVRGLNNGLADAHNIGWKLAWVLDGRADEALLDSYSPERRGATLDVFANSGKSARFMTPPTRGLRLMRDAALSLALDHPFAGRFANPRNMVPYSYADSPLTTPDRDGFAAGPAPGELALDADLGDGFLLDRAGAGFTLLAFGGGPVARLAGDTELTILDLPGDGDLAARYGARPGSAYLLRPDLHVAARWHAVAADDITGTCRALCKGTTP